MIYFEHYHELDSTQRLAKERAMKGAQSGLVISAEHQTNGRGRLGRSWQSLGQCLQLSLIYRSDLPLEKLAGLTLYLGLAVVEMLNDFDLMLKWPNDIYFQNAKVGGLLCEYQDGAIIVGLGLNIAAEPDDLAQVTDRQAISLMQIRDVTFDLPSLRHDIAFTLTKACSDFEKTGLPIERYRSRSLSIGKKIRYDDKVATVISISDDGGLVVTDDCGHTSTLYAGEVEFINS